MTSIRELLFNFDLISCNNKYGWFNIYDSSSTMNPSGKKQNVINLKKMKESPHGKKKKFLEYGMSMNDNVYDHDLQ